MFRPTLLVVLLSLGLTLAISMDRMLTSSIDKCIGGSPSMKTTTEDCFRNQIIEYLSPSAHKNINGTPRTLNNNDNFDDKGEFILNSLTEIAKNNIFRIELPEVFQRATLVFRPNRGLDFGVEFPKDEENDVTPRQEKMLFPLLMLVKLKLKALTPILLAFVGLKATKALILSKIAILLVIGFLIVQLCQKLGMAKMNMQPAVTPPVPMYGPPTTLSSYDPSGWEPAPGPPGPYSRVYETNPSTTAHHMAYSAYSTQAAKYRR
ncbi:hypothetical protein O3M35_012244 [Rhynocoris fuscipes]|uniref:Osiris 20 n=1 Tax=Rhynocoris fuscipes TaxID=488301 RepID=A0AAW1CY61_9HEMI